MDNKINCGYETLTNMLNENKKQLSAITEVAKNILKKIDGCDACQIKPCSEKPKDPELPGVLKQTNDNIILTGDLYSLILDIESRL